MAAIDSIAYRHQLPFWAPRLMRSAVLIARFSGSCRVAGWLGWHVGRIIGIAMTGRIIREL